jgi:hypothetical protein
MRERSLRTYWAEPRGQPYFMHGGWEERAVQGVGPSQRVPAPTTYASLAFTTRCATGGLGRCSPTSGTDPNMMGGAGI